MMDENRFQIFAVRILEGCRFGRRLLKTGCPYYLYEGFDIEDEGDTVWVIDDVVNDMNVYNDYLREKAALANNNSILPYVSI